jgi:hypothetical protein
MKWTRQKQGGLQGEGSLSGDQGDRTLAELANEFWG